MAVLAALGTLACVGLGLFALASPQPVTALFWLLLALQVAVPGFAAWTAALVCVALVEAAERGA